MEMFMCIALVQEHRKPGLNGQFQLCGEGGFLQMAWGKITVEVEPGFADRNHVGLLRDRMQLGAGVNTKTGGIVRMQPGSTIKEARHHASQRCGKLTAGDAGAGQHHGLEPSRDCSSNHVFTVVIEAFVAEIDADVDQRGKGALHARYRTAVT